MQLLYPGFLWGTLAIAVPIVIHLLQLRRPQRVLFTNTGFIREVELTTMRRRQLQEMLVLLTRVIAIGALVLLFCQPFLSTDKQDTIGDAGLVSVLVDNSGSMQAVGQTQRQLRQEALMAGEVLGRSYSKAARFKLLNQKGSNLQLASYLAAIADQRIAVRGWGNSGARQALQQEQTGPLYIISDFQKSEMPPQLLQQVQRREPVVLLPLVAKQTGNIYVDSVWLNDAFVRARTNIALHIRLHNGGTEVVTNCPVKILLGKQQVATLQISVKPGQSNEAVVQVQLPDNKLAMGQIVTQDVPVTFDNTYYFTLQPAASVNVVEIGEEPMARSAYVNEPLFAYSFAKPQAVDYGLLRRANMVLVREVPQVEAGLCEALASVVRRGGSVVVVPAASPTAHASYQKLFKVLGVVGEQWDSGTSGSLSRQEVLMPSARNPFFKEVFGAQPPRVVMPQVAPILHLRQAGTDILRLRDGDGFLTEFSNGAGRTYVFAAPFAKEYSDFTAHPLFVPVLYRLAMLSYRTDQLPAYRLTASSVALSVPAKQSDSKAEASYRLVRDSLAFIPAQHVQGGQLLLEVPTGLTNPGFYKLQYQGSTVTTLAFNAPKRESELAAYSAAELRQLIGPNHPNVRVLDTGTQPTALAQYRSEQAGQPLWRYCLLLVLVSLLAEALLLRFGRRKRVGRPVVAA